MKKTKSNSKKKNWSSFFFAFAILAVISGIYLILQKDYIIGISGSMTGLFLIYLKIINNAKEKNS